MKLTKDEMKETLEKVANNLGVSEYLEGLETPEDMTKAMVPAVMKVFSCDEELALEMVDAHWHSVKRKMKGYF